ncbi:hypothetical protein HDE_04795 [Halotydeus destructor]|nr:hypothetical protein HDE_04795 [Halotydeus destructor]
MADRSQATQIFKWLVIGLLGLYLVLNVVLVVDTINLANYFKTGTLVYVSCVLGARFLACLLGFVGCFKKHVLIIVIFIIIMIINFAVSFSLSTKGFALAVISAGALATLFSVYLAYLIQPEVFKGNFSS